ncbi:MAG: sugar ABC transporter permease [Chloroflexi bacterium]|nr:sugar ABC transporter permease [Anaerolinea sp.]TDA66754.1 MAG: sugar ABC transporter permease [Chloroflexota bacterium]
MVKTPLFKSLPSRDRTAAKKLVAPAVIGIWIVILFPLLYALYVSFHDWILSQGKIGEVNFSNYITVLKDPLLLNAAKNTILLTVSVVVLEIAIGFGLALLLNNKRIRLRNLYLFILLVPMLMPPITVGLIWRLLLHPDLGIINYMLSLVGLPQPIWLADPVLAMITIIIVDVWHETSFIILVLLAGLTSLPDEMYEAAMIDGASAWQKFKFVTLPLMAPTILVATIIRMIAALKTYDLVYILTRGGPGISTETISYYIYKVFFVFLDMGKSSAMAFILLAIIILMTLILMRVMRTAEQ